MKGKILVLGNFGYSNNNIDGQTIKTRNLYSLLENNYDGFVTYFDTSEIKNNNGKFFTMLTQLIRANHLVYLPAHHNLKFIYPLIYILSRIFNFSIFYIVIGGWLPEYIKERPFHRWSLSRISGIFPETQNMKRKLEEWYGFQNVKILPNFRIHNYTPIIQERGPAFRFVFMSRIIKEKGIDVIFRMCESMKERDLIGAFSIDFFGPIGKNDETYFFDNLKLYPNLEYNGVLDAQEIHSVLNNYDMLILPTRYPGEGFPGAILDAYIAGIPVLVSNWKDLASFVDEGKTGFVFNLNNENEFVERVTFLVKNQKSLIGMKEMAYEKSKQFSVNECYEVLKLKFK